MSGTSSETGVNDSIMDLGHAPPLQNYVEDEDRKGGRTASGKTGIASPPNLLALSQYYTDRKSTIQDKPRKDTPVKNIKALKPTRTILSTPLQALSALKIQPDGNHPGITANRPRKLTPIDPPGQKTLAMAVEESHHRFLGGYRNNALAEPSTNGISNLNKRAGAKRGGAGYAAAASRALQIPINYSTPMTPANSPQGSRQALQRTSFNNLDTSSKQEEELDPSSSDIKLHNSLITPNSSPTHNLLRKDTFSIENPSTFGIPLSNQRILHAIAPQDS